LEPAAAIPIAVFMFKGNLTLTVLTAIVGGVVALAASTYAYRYAKKKIELWRVTP
jgi:NADH-quinone oxidoreductase subunit A